jgi:hypothetical protein
VRFELRNVVANYPFERSHRFAGSSRILATELFARLSCGVGDTQLGAGFRRAECELLPALSRFASIVCPTTENPVVSDRCRLLAEEYQGLAAMLGDDQHKVALAVLTALKRADERDTG